MADMGDMSSNRLIYALCAVAFATVVFSLLTRGRPPARERVVSTEQLTSYARATLAEIQPRSIANNQEYCGVIFEDEEGNLQTSKIYAGERAACALDWGVPLGYYVVASFHSHGGFDTQYASEIPSSLDLATDIDARIDGFVGTPGGRIWHNRWQNEATELACGEACLPVDPRYEAFKRTSGQRLNIARRYSMDELNNLFGIEGA